MGRKRKMYRADTWRGQELSSREDLKSQGLKVAPYVSYESFRKRWMKEHKGADTPEGIIREFWGDYVTSNAKSLSNYFERIQR